MRPRLWNVLDQAFFMLWVIILLNPGADVWGQVEIRGPIKIVQQGQQVQVVAVQNNSADPAAINEDLADNVFVPADRHTLQRLFQAKQLIAKARYGEAVQNLGAILNGPEDYFFQPQQNQPSHRSLKVEAQRLIGQMPKEGRELYELQYGAQARQLLEEGSRSGDAKILAEVSRRYFHTQAGYEATFLLGLYHLDHGRSLAGSLTLQRLMDSSEISDQFEPALSLAMASGWLQAGASDKAREVLEDFFSRHPQLAKQAIAEKTATKNNIQATLNRLTKQVGIPQVSQPAESDQWLMFRGNPQRNETTSGGVPLLNLCWRVATTDDPLIDEAMEQNRRYNYERGAATLSGLHPLVVDDVVLIRTYKNLLAVDFSNGKRLWEVPEDGSLENVTAVSDNDTSSQSVVLAALLSQRTTSDATFGTLSSDGSLVFGIEDSGPALGIKPVIIRNQRVINLSNMAQGMSNNRLAAYDVHTGKLKWQLGGAANDYGVRMPEAFFLGPPLPLMGQLYVLAEMKGEIRLLALDADKGNLLWSQQLAVVERSVEQDPIRRLTGISPSYGDGVLICPTSTGALVAVELATRSLLWGYRYGRDYPGDYFERLTTSTIERAAQNVPAVDANVCVAEGRVVVTPIDSDSLHCLNLIDGELCWKFKRQDEIYVACVNQGKVIIVGRHQVKAIRLADGKPAWDGQAVPLPEGAMPSGRGFISGDSYFVPLDSAEVAAINLNEGKITHLSKSRKGHVPGNLICYKGRVISQGSDGVDAFYQLDSAQNEVGRRLAADPANSDALCLQGEIFLDAGKRGEAVDCFRRAYAANGDPRSRQLLREALLEGLQQEFAAYRSQNTEIVRLLDDSLQEATYLRLMTVGLQQSGDLSGAFEHCWKLIDLESDQAPMEKTAKLLSVRRDRWIETQMALLRMEAKGDIADKIDSAIKGRFETSMTSGSMDSLRRFLDHFGNQPIASQARAELVRKLTKVGQLLEAEMTLWESFSPSGAASNARVLADVADMFIEAGQKDSAASTYNWLRRRFGNAICRDGKTVEQLIEELPTDDAMQKLLDRRDPWPTGDVEVVSNQSKNNLMSNYNRSPLKLKGSPGPYFANVNLTYDPSRHMLLCFDALGNNLWQLVMSEVQLQRQQFIPYNPAFSHIRALGHLLLFSVSGRLYAIDTLGGGGNGHPRIIWSQNINEMSGDLSGLHPFIFRAPLPGIMSLRMMQMYGQNNDLEPATTGLICVQHSRSLIALDPLNGSKLWIRDDIPQGSVTFGDEEYVFVLPPDKSEALVLRALDGELLGTRKIPRNKVHIDRSDGQVVNYAPLNEICPATIGRNMMLWRTENNKRVLEVYDPWTQKSAWEPRKFAIDAQYCLVGSEAIGVMQPSGQFVLLNLPDGRTLAEVKLKAEPNLVDLTVMESDDQYLVLTHASQQAPGAPPQRPMNPLSGAASKLVISGRLYALDRNGKLRWPAPVQINNQQLLVNQPPGLPVLVFVCQSYEQRQNTPDRPQLYILAVDKRSGRTVYDNKISNSTGIFNVVGNMEKKTVDFIMQRRTITLTFTDKPLPPPDNKSEIKKTDQSPLEKIRGFFKLAEKTMKQMFGLFDEDDWDKDTSQDQ